MDFEFDDRKSRSNKQKHGIDFVEAQSIWDDPEVLEIPLKSDDELRIMMIARIEGKHWSAIITRRKNHVRIISVRRSRTEERELYES